jgi:hypothetical protein
LERLRQHIAGGTPPSEIAASVIDAMRENRLYVLPHPAMLEQARQRFQAIEADTLAAPTARRGRPSPE